MLCRMQAQICSWEAFCFILYSVHTLSKFQVPSCWYMLLPSISDGRSVTTVPEQHPLNGQTYVGVVACRQCVLAKQVPTVFPGPGLHRGGDLILSCGSCDWHRDERFRHSSSPRVLTLMTCHILTSFHPLWLSAQGARQSSSPCPTSPSRTFRLPNASSPSPTFPPASSP
jgi:hypothetical protein